MDSLQKTLYEEIKRIPTLDIHSHIDAGAPVALNLRELLGYHYFTELAHSAGLEASVVSRETPDEIMLPRLVEAIDKIDNTVQYSWLIELAQTLFGFAEDRVTPDNWQSLADAVKSAAERPGRAREILDASSITKVYLTNNFDEDLSGIDGNMFVPCLRTDSLVMHWESEDTRQSFEKATGGDGASVSSLNAGLDVLFSRFRDSGAASAAISLPSDFTCRLVGDSELDTVLARVASGAELSDSERDTLRVGIFYRIAEKCRQYRMPFQLMIGVIRGGYKHGVYQGMDLVVVGGSLSQYLDLFNRFPEVDFTVSILSMTQSQELACYGWILPNVKCSGHWWYATVPSLIEQELRNRLECVPKNKLIGYYSDMYKLEFGLPKLNMFRRVLSKILAEDYVLSGRLSEEGAVDLAKLLMHDNAVEIFGEH